MFKKKQKNKNKNKDKKIVKSSMRLYVDVVYGIQFYSSVIRNRQRLLSRFI